MGKCKALRLVGLLLISVLGLAGCLAPPPVTLTPEVFTKNVATLVKERWPYMGKAWPTYDFKRHYLVLYIGADSPANMVVALVDWQGGRVLQKEDYAQLPVPRLGEPLKVNFRGRPSVALSVPKEALTGSGTYQYVYRVATRALVGMYYQDDAYGAFGGKGHSFVGNREARLYRQMALRNLLEAYADPKGRGEHLGRAKYWVGKWKSKFAGEVRAVTSADIRLGVGAYTDIFGIAVTADSTLEEVRRDSRPMLPWAEVFVSYTEESRALGQVAGFLLDEEMPGWKDSFYAEKVSLVDKLLSSVKPIKQAPDADFDRKYDDAVAERNRELADIAASGRATPKWKNPDGF